MELAFESQTASDLNQSTLEINALVQKQLESQLEINRLNEKIEQLRQLSSISINNVRAEENRASSSREQHVATNNVTCHIYFNNPSNH